MKRNNGSIQVQNILLIIGLSILLAACGGGGGGDTESASQGVFLDSPVEGLRFETATQSGTTDANGTFSYMPGEMVEFFIGDISLGRVAGAATLTPIDLVPGAMDETNEYVTNMLRFLQSLDDDLDATNGIQITSTFQAAMMGQTLDFMQATADFETAFNSLSASMLGGRGLVSIVDAQAHMRDTLDGMMGGGSDPGNPGGLGSLSVSGADTGVIGSSFSPTSGNGTTIQASTAVSWADMSGTSAGISANGNELVSLSYVFASGSIVGGEISIQLYSYAISCWPVVAAECSNITLDIPGKRLVLNNAQLSPFSSVISTNYATAPVTLNGTLYWE